jgi:hypothetical protein
METQTHSLELIGEQRLLVERRTRDDLIRLIGPEGRLTLSIIVTPTGPVLRFEGPGLLIESSGALAIDAEHVAIRGREGVALVSGGDAKIVAEGTFDTEAHRQNIRASRGDVNVYANDDVKIDGERIRMNC